ncbi:hypothetical protein [Parvularcula dongshanensis]|uniref:Anti-sigma factor RsiW n=1 Tax=Parvularcula dongshanensis TaxID=1173995 RepID=A0A840I1Z5_9PROT|nr:hypothetical protein [Parvularcula dongshanensis]MBB4658839.1 anti-sigma factor RsiW [Parvularcula dongshanensis]
MVHLITEQDIHAYVDDELTPARRRAVEAFLADRHLSLAQAVTYLRTTFDLRSLKREIYADDALRGEVEALLARRRAKTGEEGAAPLEKSRSSS